MTRRPSFLYACASSALAAPALAQGVDFQGIGFLPKCDINNPAAVSDDGRVVAGLSELNVITKPGPIPRAYRWSRESGMQDLGTAQGFGAAAQAMSADGSVIAGVLYVGYSGKFDLSVFRWTSGGGMSDIGLWSGECCKGARVVGMSADGSVILADFTTGIAAWTQGGGWRVLPLPPGIERASPEAISRDGSAVVGWGRPPGSDFRRFPIVWRAGQPELLPDSDLPAHYSTALAVSADGRVIAGVLHDGEHPICGGVVDAPIAAVVWRDSQPPEIIGEFAPAAMSADGLAILGTRIGFPQEAVIWSGADGVRGVKPLLEQAGLDMFAWEPYWPRALSADGRTVVGAGTNPGGLQGGWIARLSGACRPDRNLDARLDGADRTLFDKEWSSQWPGGDFNIDGRINDEDRARFQEAFDAGCH